MFLNIDAKNSVTIRLRRGSAVFHRPFERYYKQQVRHDTQ